MKGKGSGWKNESRRHSLARKGIKTVTSAQGKQQHYLKNSNGKRIFTGDVAEKVFWYIMNNENEIDYSIPYEERKSEYIYPEYVGYSGYFYEDGMWTAWDNSFGECLVENFNHKEVAKLFATNLELTHSTLHYADKHYEYYEKAIIDGTLEEIGGLK